MNSLLEKIGLEESKRRSAFACRIYCCAGTACLSANGSEVMVALKEAVATQGKDDQVAVLPTGCMGLCSEGPLVRVEMDDRPPVLYGRVNTLLARLVVAEHVLPALAGKIAEDWTPPNFLKEHRISLDLPFFKKQKRVVLDRIDSSAPDRIEDAILNGAYYAWADCKENMKPQEIIEQLRLSGLRGRGGGGYPVASKWATVASGKSTKRYVICNGDEGDPGAYMDRSVLEGDPHAVLEGLMIAALAMGADYGYVYIRAEYNLAVERMQIAIKQARALGFIGVESGFDCEVFCGGGAFVCGEETALIKSIEGQRGTPRPRPPFPSQRGLFGKPTAVNNVETLANVPRILGRGGEWFRSIGTQESTGTKVFSLAGRGRFAGLIEVPMGTPLRTVVEEIGGGTRTNRPIKAVQTGGLSGGIITAPHLDTPLTYEAMSGQGSIMGSGGMIILDEADDLLELAIYYLNHAVNESCGRCAACRIGGTQLLTLAKKLRETPEDKPLIDLIFRVSETMEAASLCGLGKATPRQLLSVIRHVLPKEGDKP
jgi:NADH:ubiquinone oxidoreductase subunit F (NADH-binding)/(2Fe-2S) ferredoxin